MKLTEKSRIYVYICEHSVKAILLFANKGMQKKSECRALASVVRYLSPAPRTWPNVARNAHYFVG